MTARIENEFKAQKFPLYSIKKATLGTLTFPQAREEEKTHEKSQRQTLTLKTE
jgi:hypothetical protein